MDVVFEVFVFVKLVCYFDELFYCVVGVVDDVVG